MCEMCVDQPLELGLHTTASPRELWSRWESMREVLGQAGVAMSEASTAWREATDPAIKDRLWTEYEAAAREVRVLDAWTSLFYVAYIFTTDGADAAALDSSMPLHLSF